MGIRRTTTAIAMLAVTTGFGSVVAVQDTPRDLQDPEFPEDGFYLTSLTRYRSQSLTFPTKVCL